MALLSGVLEVWLTSGSNIQSNGRPCYVLLNCGPYEQVRSSLTEGSSDPVFNQVHTLCVNPGTAELTLWIYATTAGKPDEGIGWIRIQLLSLFQGSQPQILPETAYTVMQKSSERIAQLKMGFAFTPGQFHRPTPTPTPTRASGHSCTRGLIANRGSGSKFKSLFAGVLGLGGIAMSTGLIGGLGPGLMSLVSGLGIGTGSIGGIGFDTGNIFGSAFTDPSQQLFDGGQYLGNASPFPTVGQNFGAHTNAGLYQNTQNLQRYQQFLTRMNHDQNQRRQQFLTTLNDTEYQRRQQLQQFLTSLNDQQNQRREQFFNTLNHHYTQNMQENTYTASSRESTGYPASQPSSFPRNYSRRTTF